jgi:hypothetical protein
MPIFHREAKGTMTASTGTISKTIQTMHGFINQIYVKSATASTTFDVKITDDGSRNIYYTLNETGLLNELIKLPTLNPVTLTIENASRDEAFSYYISIEE